MPKMRHRAQRADGSRWTVPGLGPRKARNRRREAAAKKARKVNR